MERLGDEHQQVQDKAVLAAALCCYLAGGFAMLPTLHLQCTLPPYAVRVRIV